MPNSFLLSLGVMGLLLVSSAKVKSEGRVSGRLPFGSLLFHKIDPFLSSFSSFGPIVVIERYSMQNNTLLYVWEGKTSTSKTSSRYISSSAQRN